MLKTLSKSVAVYFRLFTVNRQTALNILNILILILNSIRNVTVKSNKSHTVIPCN